MDSYSKGIPFLFEPDFENLFGVECLWRMGKDHIRNHHQDESSAYLPYVLFSSKVPCDDVIESPRISKSTVGQAHNLPANSCFGPSTLWLRVFMTYGISEYVGICRTSYESLMDIHGFKIPGWEWNIFEVPKTGRSPKTFRHGLTPRGFAATAARHSSPCHRERCEFQWLRGEGKAASNCLLGC